MKPFKRILALLLVAVTPYMLFAQDPDDRRLEEIQKFIDEKQKVSLSHKDVNLTISGDVRAKWEHYTETLNGTNQRTHTVTGKKPGTSYLESVGPDEFKGEFNLNTDYRKGNAWAKASLRFKNTLSNTDHGGTKDKLNLRVMQVGYRVWENSSAYVDLIAGRTPGYFMFDSNVQFDSNFDGLFARYNHSFPSIFELQIQGGPMVVSSRSNNYAWIGEASFYKIAETGLVFKYSFIDWNKNGQTEGKADSSTVIPLYTKNAMWAYQISQFLLSYELGPEILGKTTAVHGAYGINSAAKGSAATNGTKANQFWYAGAKYGSLKKANDWSVALNYQVVGAQAIRDGDVSGIGRGNFKENKFNRIDSSGTVEDLGDTNYKGWSLKGGYAVTNELLLGVGYSDSRAKDKNIGGNHKFRKVEAEVIYAF